MWSMSFLSGKKADTRSYIFLLFLAGENIYGFGLNENNPTDKSKLYVEQADPFLKDAVSKIETIIHQVEKDLGAHVYLKKTVLFLNSLYVTEAGGIREDFRQSIKKLLRDLDLENLGYVNFYEVVNFNFGKQYEHYALIEESVYDYAVYLFQKGHLTKTSKIAKSPTDNADKDEIKKILHHDEHLVAFYYHRKQKSLFGETVAITQEQLGELLTNVYYKDKPAMHHKQAHETASTPAAVVLQDEPKETIAAAHNDFLENDLPEAPGFAVHTSFEEHRTTAHHEVSKAKHHDASYTHKNYLKWLPRSVPKWLFVLIGIIVTVSGVCASYLFFFHTAEITLATRKENFSTNITFTLGGKSGVGSVFTHPFEVKAEKTATGERIVGEKADGEVTIGNGTFKDKTFASGTVLRSSEGIVFVTEDSVSVPAASSPSASFQLQFGKKNVKVKASAVGAEGNIDKGIKLVLEGVSELEAYALAADDFTGGFKKTVRVLSQEDRNKLEERAYNQVEKAVQERFASEKNEDYILFIETLMVDNEDKRFSAKVNEEVSDATLTYSGSADVLYVPKALLSDRVQKDKLKDKEFVQGTFQLKKIKLKDESDGKFEYEAVVNGKVQNLVDLPAISARLSLMPVEAARKLLLDYQTIEEAHIVLKPLPVPFMPPNSAHISISFDN